MLGRSQARLGAELGVTAQQIQKYENGANQIASSSLYEISKLLLVPVSYFYDGFDDGGVEENDVEWRNV